MEGLISGMREEKPKLKSQNINMKGNAIMFYPGCISMLPDFKLKKRDINREIKD